MLLQVENLVTSFRTPRGTVRAVDGVSFELERGKTLGIVGESGCGKTVSALSIIRLIQEPPGKIESGRILFNGKNLLDLSSSEMRKVRGKDISMIFQEPMTSLNPVFTVGDQIQEVILLHQDVRKTEARKRCLEIMNLVGIPDAEERVDYYPHQMSGGLRQRIMIAMALSCNPQLLIADEPTTALDVTIQSQILQLMKELQKKLQMAMIIITHDFGVIAEVADEVAVMYAGKIVEKCSVKEIFDSPAHPYTVGLQRSIPSFANHREKLYTIPGIVPDPLHLPKGCRYSDRCEFMKEDCHRAEPSLKNVGALSHEAACYFPRNEIRS
jgi:oligopeptide/dipeptide ABC transporter ATP-binding protein